MYNRAFFSREKQKENEELLAIGLFMNKNWIVSFLDVTDSQEAKAIQSGLITFLLNYQKIYPYQALQYKEALFVREQVFESFSLIVRWYADFWFEQIQQNFWSENLVRIQEYRKMATFFLFLFIRILRPEYLLWEG